MGYCLMTLLTKEALTFLISQDIADIAAAKIRANVNLPDNLTTEWTEVVKAYEQLKWYIPHPPAEGWTNPLTKIHYSYDEMMSGVVNYIAENYDELWFVPSDGKL